MLVKNRILKVLWAVYPLVVTFVVMVTAYRTGSTPRSAPSWRRVRLRRELRLRTAPGRGLGLAHRQAKGHRREPTKAGAAPPPVRRHGAATASPEIRELARDRLIESRLTRTRSRSPA